MAVTIIAAGSTTSIPSYPGLIEVSGGSGTTSLTLPSMALIAESGGIGKTYIIKDVNGLAGTSAITITPTGSGTKIDGASTLVMNVNFQTTSLIPDGVNWASISSSAGSGSLSTTLTGDVTGSGSGSVATTLAATGVTAGTYQGLTVNAKGLVTSAASVAYLTTNQTVTVSGDATGSGATAIALTLASTGVTAGTYSGLTVNAKGLVTSAVIPPYVIVSGAGTNQGTATSLTSALILVTTVASGTGVIFTAIPATHVINRGANSLLVYPPSGAQIETLGANAAFTVAAGADARFIMASSTQFYALASSFQ